MPHAPLNLLPSSQSAAEIREAYSRAVRQRSLFSARTTQAGYLERMQDVINRFLTGDVTEAYARQELQFKLQELGYDPELGGFPGDVDVPPAEPGGLRDLSSDMRLELILRTQQQMANNLARAAANAADPYELHEYPAWSFERVGVVERPRDWMPRWAAAGNSVGWEGAVADPMVALKSSPIWAALGDGAGGYTDVTGSDVPPFAYNSLMDWVDVTRDEAFALGLIDEAEEQSMVFDGGLAADEINDVLDSFGPEFEAELRRELEALL